MIHIIITTIATVITACGIVTNIYRQLSAPMAVATVITACGTGIIVVL